MSDDELREYFLERRVERAELRAVLTFLRRQLHRVEIELARNVSQDTTAAKLVATSAHAAGNSDRERIGLDVLALIERETPEPTP